MGSHTSEEAKLTVLDFLTWINIAAYTFVLLFDIRNAAKYLVMQGKWRKFFMTTFYLFTFVVATGRIIYLVSYYSFRKDPD